MTTENYVDKIDTVLNGFDFDGVHAYMKLTDWKWFGDNGYYLPTVSQLKATAESLLWRVTDDGKTLVGNGGFYAYRFDYGIKLTFEPFRSSTF